MIDFLKELWGFMKVRKKYWMLPILLFLSLIGVLVAYTQGSSILPFLYSFF